MRNFVLKKSRNFAKYRGISFRFAYVIPFSFAKLLPLSYSIRIKKMYEIYEILSLRNFVNTLIPPSGSDAFKFVLAIGTSTGGANLIYRTGR
jgi:hypothetical protein